MCLFLAVMLCSSLNKIFLHFVCSGSWSHGAKHGQGIYVYKADGAQLIGKWVQNKFKQGVWKTKDGVRYATEGTGRFVRNAPNGPGSFTFPSGNVRCRQSLRCLCSTVFDFCLLTGVTLQVQRGEFIRKKNIEETVWKPLENVTVP